MTEEDLIIRFANLGTSYTQARTAKRTKADYSVDYLKTVKHLKRELVLLHVRGPVIIQLDVDSRYIRADETGLKADAPKPAFPGIRLTMTSNTRGTLSYQCDVHTEWRHNLRAIGLGLERLRLVSDTGIANDGQQYRGWKALPAPDHADISTIDAAAAYIAMHAKPDVITTAGEIRAAADVARRAYRAAASHLHADVYKAADQVDKWQRLQAAWGLIEQMHDAGVQ